MSSYLDIFNCPKCKDRRAVFRQSRSAGKVVQTYCCRCRKMVKVKAGLPATEKRKT